MDDQSKKYPHNPSSSIAAPMSGKALFHLPGRKHVSEEVLERLINLLKSGHLSPGERLPPERELGVLMRVSRPSLRQALGALQLLGIVESVQGRGTYLVQSLDRLPLEPYLFRLLLNNGSLEELMEIRKLIEPEVAAFAAERADEESLKEVQVKLYDFERRIAEGDTVEAVARAGVGFHEALAQASGNHTLAALLKSLSDLVNTMGQLLVARQPSASLESYRKLTAAVLDRDPQTARGLMREHLVNVEHRLAVALDDVRRAQEINDRAPNQNF